MDFYMKLPRNFTISLVVELLIAQSLARFVIFRMH